MTTFFEFTAIAIPSIALVAAVLFFSRKHVHRQMEEIAKAAKTGAYDRE